VAEYRWDLSKNERLSRDRGVMFEDVLLALEQGRLLDILEHPNAERYRHQKVLVVEIRRYAYAVPCVEHGAEIFLKTIIPSRKLTRRYLRERGVGDG